MPLYLTEPEVKRLITMPEAIAAVEAAFADQGAGRGAQNQARSRFFLPQGVLHTMSAALPSKGVMGTKTYTSFGTETRFWVMLYSAEDGSLLAMIEGDRLGQIRTGAATGVAARHLAREDATMASLFGTGWQAETQAEALLVARPNLREVQVHSRDAHNRETFCRKMTARLGIRFSPFGSAEEAARTTQILITATSAREPILRGEWLSPGDFVAAVGANRFTAREIDETVVARADRVVVDDLDQARLEAAELIYAYERRKWSWASAVSLAQVVAGPGPARRSGDEILVFKSLGIALEDVAVAQVVYENARSLGLGREL
ncbi:MAG: ornithine cyclodeaminase family protein [Cytophagales bacterium]|nr:ornithine cyclodeaminase family protein [Armatimonadota bacterium]